MEQFKSPACRRSFFGLPGIESAGGKLFLQNVPNGRCKATPGDFSDRFGYYRQFADAAEIDRQDDFRLGCFPVNELVVVHDFSVPEFTRRPV